MKRTPLKRGKPLARKEWKPKRTSLARGQAFKARRTRIKPKSDKKVEFDAEFARIRAMCVVRANGRCECPCAQPFGPGEGTAECDHVLGRNVTQRPETMMLMRRECHRHKTEHSPSAAHWHGIHADFCVAHGYSTDAAESFRLRDAALAKQAIRRA